MVIELFVLQFCSEIIFVTPKFSQTCTACLFDFEITHAVWFQTKLHFTHINYHYKYLSTFTCSNNYTDDVDCTVQIGGPVDSTYPITNNGTLTNICGQRKSNHVIPWPHDLRFLFKKCSFTFNFLGVNSGCEWNDNNNQ